MLAANEAVARELSDRGVGLLYRVHAPPSPERIADLQVELAGLGYETGDLTRRRNLAQFLKSIKRTGFGPNLFDELRYLDRGEPGQDCSARPLNMEFALNQPRYQGASILLGRENFGCGSSRQQAVDCFPSLGVQAVIAQSYGAIYERNAINAPIQGSAADIIKRAMIEVDRWIRSKSPDVTMIMQVHDELVFEVGEQSVDSIVPEIVSMMEQAADLSVPLVVDAGHGANWDEAH